MVFSPLRSGRWHSDRTTGLTDEMKGDTETSRAKEEDKHRVEMNQGFGGAEEKLSQSWTHVRESEQNRKERRKEQEREGGEGGGERERGE